MSRFIAFVELHFPVMVLVVMFFGGSFLLAHYGMNEEMSRWIEGSPVIVALVAILRGQNYKPEPEPDNQTKEKTSV